MELDIKHDTRLHQFYCIVDSLRCVLDYQLRGDTMAITHTGVPGALEGQGIAGRLTRFALDEARSQGWKVRPLCSYAAAYIRRHPEYQSLLA